MVDLLDHAVLVGGLDHWSFLPGRTNFIQEPRLRDAIARQFEAEGKPLSFDRAFIEPPSGDDNDPTRSCGVRILEFPQWFVCQNQACRALVRSYDGLEQKRGHYHHQCERNRTTECVPVRFVSACRRGHVEDFRWVAFAHQGRERCAAPSMRLREGATGDFSEIQVSCACGARALLAGAMVPEANPRCGGRRPWLGREGTEECEEKLRLLVRTASNSYFSQVVSALSVPEKGREVEEAVRKVFDVLKAADKSTLPAFRTIPKVKAAIDAFSDQEVLAAVDSIRKGKPTPRAPLRTAEFLKFVEAKPEQPGDLPGATETFYVRSAAPEGGLPTGIARLVLAHKLREVRVQIGFTRIESASPNLQGEYDLGVESARLGLATDWLPATEIRGEGVFIQLDEEALQAWEDRPAVQERGAELLQGYDAWMSSVSNAPLFPGVRFYLLHSLSHLLISAISLECGYAASAIRERLYCAPANDETPMAAILLSTGTSGTDGTLGGLVEQGRQLRDHLQQAYDLGILCSNDPVCSSHNPATDPTDRFLEGSACHGCLFIAECSCERFNKYLDRALVVPTLGRDSNLAFFSARP